MPPSRGFSKGSHPGSAQTSGATVNVVTGFPQACLEDDEHARVLIGPEAMVRPAKLCAVPDAKALVAWDRVVGTATATVEGDGF